MLQCIPSASSILAAWTPSQVVDNLISTRSRLTPALSYRPISFRALATEPSTSNDSLRWGGFYKVTKLDEILQYHIDYLFKKQRVIRLQFSVDVKTTAQDW